MKSLKCFLLSLLLSLSVSAAEARKKSGDTSVNKIFRAYSLKNLAKAKSAKARRLRAALEDGGVMIEYSYSKKVISGDKHGLIDLKAEVIQKISDNFVEEPLANFIPSGKAGAKICRIEGHNGYFRTRMKFDKKNRPSFVVMMSDDFNQRILSKDMAKYKDKSSRVDPNDASQVLISKLSIKSTEALCTE